MDTILDKSWLTNSSTNASNKEKNDFLYNSLQGIVDKQKKKHDFNDFTSGVNDLDGIKNINSKNPLFFLPNVSPNYLILESKSYFTGAQKWIGHVTYFNESVFKARLNDLNDPTTHEIGEFEITEIPPQDMELLSIGAAFYWSVGKANVNGQVEKKSLIRFQRMKPWSTTDYDSAIDKAESLFNELNWE